AYARRGICRTATAMAVTLHRRWGARHLCGAPTARPRLDPVSPQRESSPVEIVLIVVALLGFWLIVMRPARVQQRKVAELQAAIAVGDEVVITAGIFGTVVAIEDERVQLEVAPGTVITVARAVLVRRVPDADADAAEGQD